jgi:D-tyrosyl-tRNA(Tyr) deacylase
MIEGNVVSEIGAGYCLLLGVVEEDGEKQADMLAEKIVHLRVMSDENDKMNKSILDVGGEMLVVSQFTLAADVKGGRRPSFVNAAKPDIADGLYQYFVGKLKQLGVKKVVTGTFGAYMIVQIVNDGPVTILLDTNEV